MWFPSAWNSCLFVLRYIFCFEVHRFKALCILFTSHGYETFRYNILISSMLLVKVSKSNDLATFWLICVSKKVWYVFVVRNAYRMACLLLNVLWRCNLYYVFLFFKRSIPNQILVRVRPVKKQTKNNFREFSKVCLSPSVTFLCFCTHIDIHYWVWF